VGWGYECEGIGWRARSRVFEKGIEMYQSAKEREV
jgi:hypothetical protein